MVRIFKSDAEPEDVLVTIKESMEVEFDGPTGVVSFATNRGKGSGAQKIPVSEFDDYVSALEEFVHNGIHETFEPELSPAEMVRETITNIDGTITFRVRRGKGSKPAKIPADRFAEAVALLRDCVTLVEQYEDEHWADGSG